MCKFNWKCGADELPEYGSTVLLRYAFILNENKMSHRKPFISNLTCLAVFRESNVNGHYFPCIADVTIKEDKIIFSKTSGTCTSFKNKEKLKMMYWSYIADDMIDSKDVLKTIDEELEAKLTELRNEYDARKKEIENLTWIEVDKNWFDEVTPNIEAHLTRLRKEHLTND